MSSGPGRNATQDQEQGGGSTEASTAPPGEAWVQATEPDGLVAPVPRERLEAQDKSKIRHCNWNPRRGKAFNRRLNLKCLSAAFSF